MSASSRHRRPGNPIMISGNNGNRVSEAPISRGRIYAYVMPNWATLRGGTSSMPTLLHRLELAVHARRRLLPTYASSLRSHQFRFLDRDRIAGGDAAAGDHLGIDAAIGMAEAAHQRVRNVEVARRRCRDRH